MARVGVRVGAVHRVVADAFEQSFQMVAAGGVADGADDRGGRRAGHGHCMDCRRDFESRPRQPARLRSLDVAVEGGDEVVLEWLAVRRRGRPTELAAASSCRPHTHADGRLTMCLAIPGRGRRVRCPATTTSWPWSTSSASSARSTSACWRTSRWPGDWVLIHVGFAMSKVDEKEAAEALRMLEMMGQAFTDELQAVAESSIE